MVVVTRLVAGTSISISTSISTSAVVHLGAAGHPLASKKLRNQKKQQDSRGVGSRIGVGAWARGRVSGVSLGGSVGRWLSGWMDLRRHCRRRYPCLSSFFLFVVLLFLVFYFYPTSCVVLRFAFAFAFASCYVGSSPLVPFMYLMTFHAMPFLPLPLPLPLPSFTLSALRCCHVMDHLNQPNQSKSKSLLLSTRAQVIYKKEKVYSPSNPGLPPTARFNINSRGGVGTCPS